VSNESLVFSGHQCPLMRRLTAGPHIDVEAQTFGTMIAPASGKPQTLRSTGYIKARDQATYFVPGTPHWRPNTRQPEDGFTGWRSSLRSHLVLLGRCQRYGHYMAL